MKCYHRTAAGREIIANGFRDGVGTYFTGQTQRGVFLSDVPLDCNEGAKGKDLLEIDIPEEVFVKYEWVQDEITYREACIPSEIVNQFGPPRLVDEDNEELPSRF